MSGDRSIQLPPALQAGKAATKALVRAFGGQEAAASETGKSQARLSAYGVPNTADFAPIDIIHCLEARTHGVAGHPHVTRWLAREAGYALVKLPASPAETPDWHRAMGGVSKEVSDIITRLCDALADGKVTAAEVRALKVREEIAEAQERLAELDAMAAYALEAE